MKKSKASSFLKELFTYIVATIKSKSTVVKSKTNSLKTRLAVFNLLNNKKLISSTINHKIHAIMGLDKTQEEKKDSKALVLYNGDQKREFSDMFSLSFNGRSDQANDSDYIYEDDVMQDIENGDIANGDEDEEIVNGTDSVIEMVKEKEGGENEFSLENQIDHCADVFIKRFHRQMKMQKLESFKRYQEMLQRGVE